MTSLRIGPRPFLFLCRFTLATVMFNVATGAAVRLSDSGLGCPDWPTCAEHHLTPPLKVHAVIEFGNRVVVFVLVLACLATVAASFLRRPARPDLRWLSGGLILGVIGEAVLGAFVVSSGLNAYVVMVHFMVGIALLAVAVLLALRAGHGPGRGTVEVTRGALWMTRALLALLVIALTAGAATTGSGPHAGGRGAKRIPLALGDMARIHAEIVLVTGVLMLVLLWVLWHSNAPAHVQDAGRILLAAMVVQGVIGYAQYFTHLPALLVGIHVVGATMVWSIALWFHHTQLSHGHQAAEAAEAAGADGSRSQDLADLPRDSAPSVVRESA